LLSVHGLDLYVSYAALEADETAQKRAQAEQFAYDVTEDEMTN
jgi:hypothetical protein